MMNDHDILIELKSDMCWVRKQLQNHLKHHFLVALASFGAALSAITGVIIMVIKGR